MNAGTVTKKLPFPWMVAGQQVTEVEVRAPLLEDMMEAEKEGHPGLAPYAYRVAMACRQIVRAGTYTGPFVLAQFKAMTPRTWSVIVQAMDEADKLGEDEQQATTQTP